MRSKYYICRFIETDPYDACIAWLEIAPDLWVKTKLVSVDGVIVPVPDWLQPEDRFWVDLNIKKVIHLGRIARFFTIKQIDDLITILGSNDVVEMHAS